MPRRTLPDRAWVPGLLAALIAVLLSGAFLYRAHGDASRLVHAGPPWTNPALTPSPLHVGPAGDAFDGQFYYRIAISPLSNAHTVAGITFDLPGLRAVRWGYGAIAYLIAGGRPGAVPWALLLCNVVALAVIGFLGGLFARDSGKHAGWGLALALWPGFAYSLSLDTAELVASAFLLGGLLAARRQNVLLSAVLLAMAVLTRDTTVIGAIGLVAAGVLSGRRQLRQVTAGLVAGGFAIVVFVAWQLVVRARFGTLPLASSAENNLTRPVVGIARAFRDALPPASSAQLLRLISLALLVLLMAAAAISWPHSTAPLGERIAWIGGVLVVLTLNGFPWSGATSFMRAATEMGLLSVLVLLGGRVRVMASVFTCVGGVWLITAAAQIGKI